MSHLDMIGREIVVGDWVAFPNPRYMGVGMALGKIIRFTPKGVTIGFRRKWGKTMTEDTYNLGTTGTLKLDGPELLAHLLKRESQMA